MGLGVWLGSNPTGIPARDTCSHLQRWLWAWAVLSSWRGSWCPREVSQQDTGEAAGHCCCPSRALTTAVEQDSGRRRMCPRACDLGQLEALADVLWAVCIPQEPWGVSLRAAVPPAGSEPGVSQELSACCDCRALHHAAPGMRQALTVPCCWPLLLAPADKRC